MYEGLVEDLRRVEGATVLKCRLDGIGRSTGPLKVEDLKKGAGTEHKQTSQY